ncbi:MAG: glycosyl hydrolase-related protein [Planctomycetota bacterium]|nr:glycosyl hydrolase-related protein [Planctomycetota bacterium]
MTARKPLDYTFANHMHWVDMQWLWGYQVLPDSIRDMLHLCAETGAKGNVNFDGIGYEKLASEDPAALAELREAIAAGTIEVVGASYGQPYGLFHGGESNVRQRIYGVRTVMRLLGTRPKAFWEEEFDFFPQLPQMLAGCGFEAASLFFQWTWHTPHIPKEDVPLVHWEGIDGTRLPALAKTDLCLHQWPEDFDGLLDSPAVHAAERPALVQWLELMPSPDWMCRSEVLLPRLKELFADERFELRPHTLSEMVAAHDTPTAPVRAYSMDEVFHGMSLGKNGDRVPRASHGIERLLLAAESTSCVAGLAGRPYPSWDVYPSWELEEAWRELLAAQHHDNHECEGLCGSIGARSFERASALARDVLWRNLEALADRIPGPDADEGEVVFNPLGWPCDLSTGEWIARAVPAFGWAIAQEELPTCAFEEDDATHSVRGPYGEAVVCKTTGRLLNFGPMLELRLSGSEQALGVRSVDTDPTVDDSIGVIFLGPDSVWTRYELDPTGAGIEVTIGVDPLELSERPGAGGAMEVHLPFPEGVERLLADTPYAIAEVRPTASYPRKYPSGDWMTSEQWFEDVVRPFTSHSLVDLVRPDGSGVLVLHDGSQAWRRTDAGVCFTLTLKDPWDEGKGRLNAEVHLKLLGHGGLSNAERWRLAQQHVHPVHDLLGGPGGDLPARLAPVTLEGSDGVVMTAFYREHQKAAENLPTYFRAEVRNPFVVRLVELNGEPGEVRLVPPGKVARAAKTNLMGEVLEELPPEDLTLTLRPHEIATVMLDLEAGRHQPRNLDDHRSVWATVHKQS